jgi:hypothetical protein
MDNLNSNNNKFIIIQSNNQITTNFNNTFNKIMLKMNNNNIIHSSKFPIPKFRQTTCKKYKQKNIFYKSTLILITPKN